MSVQETLNKKGLARVAFIYPPNTRHLSSFERAKSEAKKKEIRIWQVEGYVTDYGFDPEVFN